MRSALLGALCLLGAPAAMAQTSLAPPDWGRIATASDWGGLGLLQTRSARVAPDGHYEVGYSFVDPYKRYYFSNSYFPWLEATFRYTEIRNKLYSDVPLFSGDQRYKDRGADLKLRLWDEGIVMPAVAVGFQDLLGTGIFAGEYIVATKRWLDFDFSIGMGWGRVGAAGSLKNPFIGISDRFAERKGAEGTGGQVALLSLFGGEKVGIFGGVEYQTPFRGVTLKAEYDAQGYRDTDLTYPSTSPINYAVTFRPSEWFEFSFGRERGNTTMLRFSLRTNFNGTGVPKTDPPPPPIGPRPQLRDMLPAETAPRPAPAPARAEAAAPRRAATGDPMFDFVAARGGTIESFGLQGDEAVIAFMRQRSDETLATLAAGLLQLLPADVRAVTVIDVSGGLERGRARTDRQDVARLYPGDVLFTQMAGAGLDLRDVTVAGNTARITVVPTDTRGTVDLSAAAKLAANALPPMDTIVAMNGNTGATETWIGFADRRDPPPQLFAGLAPIVAPGRTAGAEATLGTLTDEQRRIVAIRVRDALAQHDITLEALDLQERSAFVAVNAFNFSQYSRNLGQVARVLANSLPAPVEEITIAFLRGGLEMSRVTLRRNDLERGAAEGGAPEEILAHATFEPGQGGHPGEGVPGRYPGFEWGIFPQLRQHVGGPDRFYLYQLWVSAGAKVDLTRGLSLSGQVGKNIYHNFDRITLRSDSQLPHVRSDIKEYLQQGADNIVSLQATYLYKLDEEIYTRVSAGLLEEMYGGVSTEILWRPFDSRLALGADLSWVRKRAYDQRFTFLDYSARVGHVSIYYDTPYRDVLVAAHVGQYLARDRGVTFELSRRFTSGVRMGAWATFTNVTPQEFGEGSFDKGFFLTIPFEAFLTRSTPVSGTFAFRPLTRDGGQRLGLNNRLYDLTGDASMGAIFRSWPELLR